MQQAEQQTGIQELKPDAVACVEKIVIKIVEDIIYYQLPYDGQD